MKVLIGNYKDQEAYCLRTNELEVVVMPACGAHVASLYDRRCSYEWLYQAPGEHFRVPCYGTDFTEGECAGLDDMFPNAQKTVYRDTRLPDHGEVWALKYEVIEAGSACVRIRCKGKALPYHLEKIFSIQGATLRVDYVASNVTEEPIPFLFALHPLFRAEAGAWIEPPNKQSKITIVYTEGRKDLSEGMICSYPQHISSSGEVIDFASALCKEGTCYKYMFQDPVPKGFCRLISGDETKKLELSFSHRLLPYLGIWADHGACGRRKQRNLAIEPSTHRTTLLGEAGRGEPCYIPAKESLCWNINYSSIIAI